MARVFPHPLPESAMPGERAMYRLLSKLDDDCFVYFEPGMANRRPDFVVIMPGTGLLAIEVKDWALESLREVSPHQVLLNGVTGNVSKTHPELQARNYAFRLADLCRLDPLGRTLIETAGGYQGKLCFPISWIAAYHNISRAELDKSSFSPCFPPERNITSDVLSKWRRMDGKALRAELAKHFDPCWPHEFPQEKIDVLTSLIYPIGIGTPAGDTDSGDLHVLDEKQRQLAIFPGDGHRILRGVSGSGKTVILIARAKYLAEDPNARILLLCYNRLLRDYIAEQLNACRNVEVRTFDGWCARNGVDYRQFEPGKDLGGILRQKLESGEAPDAGRFDSVLVDEAQLMSCDWLICTRLALKETNSQKASLFIAADGAQSLQKMLRFSWKDAGIAATGNRTTILRDNYRNTTEIISIASSMLAQRDEIGGPADPALADPVKCKRHGPLPELHKLDSRAEESDYTASLIKTWILRGYSIRGKLVKSHPEDVAILYPRTPSELRDFGTRLKDALAPYPVAMLSNGDKLSTPGVRLLTMKKTTGLQFRFVILLWTDLLPGNFTNQDDEALLYMAMTRAEDVLIILHSGRSEFVGRIAAALEANGAPALG